MQVITPKFKWENPLVPLNLSKVLFIVLHHPAAFTATPEQIHRWHINNGWSGAGYNEYIRKDGTVVIMRGDNVGAQCENMNSKSYGMCCEGDYDIETKMPDVQFNSLVERLKYHKARLPNLKEIGPHKRFGNTTCPGKYFPLQQVIAALEKDNEFDNALKTWQAKGDMASPDYWAKNAVKGGLCKGEFVRQLIINASKA
jgi:hypothetical protein